LRFNASVDVTKAAEKYAAKRDRESRIKALQGDSTGLVDFPMEFLPDHTRLPIGQQSHVKSTPKGRT